MINALIVDDENILLEGMKELVQQALPKANIVVCMNARTALEEAKDKQFEIAFLDIELPGKSGLFLAKELLAIHPKTNIIFVTAYSQYAYESYDLFASGYLLKPTSLKDIKKALKNLRYPITDILRVQCFGNFQVFYNNEPVVFKRSKAKELFAYLIDRNGSFCTMGELMAILWEDREVDETVQSQLRHLISDLRKALREVNEEDILIKERNRLAVDTNKIQCDYFDYLKGDKKARNKFQGEYMTQYSWAEMNPIIHESI